MLYISIPASRTCLGTCTEKCGKLVLGLNIMGRSLVCKLVREVFCKYCVRDTAEEGGTPV